MTNNVLYVSDGDYGKRTGYLAPLVQGQAGQVIPLEIRDLANNVVNLTGYTTITGRMDNRRGGVTSIDGTLALDATPSTAPQVNWTVSATDTGTPGVFDVILVLSNGSATLKTLPVGVAIYGDPAATVVPGTAMVAVTQAQATLLAAIQGLTGLVKMAAGSASAILIKLDGTAAPTVNDDSGDGYTIGSLWVDTTNDNIYMATDVTAGAANWEQINGGGGGAVSSVFGRTGAVVAAANDYAASEIEDDSQMAKASVAAALNTLDTSITNLSNNKQDADADLTAIAGLSPSNDDIIQRKAGAWTNRTMAQLASDLGSSNEYIVVALSDETTALTTGTAKATFRMPFAMTLTGVKIDVNTAPTGSAIQVDINEDGSSILSTKLTIDATEETSSTAATPAVISDAALANDAEITVDIDAVGSVVAGKGLKLTMTGTR